MFYICPGCARQWAAPQTPADPRSPACSAVPRGLPVALLPRRARRLAAEVSRAAPPHVCVCRSAACACEHAEHAAAASERAERAQGESRASWRAVAAECKMIYKGSLRHSPTVSRAGAALWWPVGSGAAAAAVRGAGSMPGRGTCARARGRPPAAICTHSGQLVVRPRRARARAFSVQLLLCELLLALSCCFPVTFFCVSFMFERRFFVSFAVTLAPNNASLACSSDMFSSSFSLSVFVPPVEAIFLERFRSGCRCSKSRRGSRGRRPRPCPTRPWCTPSASRTRCV